MKELKDYIHLYIGCPIWDPVNKTIYTVDYDFMHSRYDEEEGVFYNDLKLILRPVESLNDEEIRDLIQYDKMAKEYQSIEYNFYPESKEIDIHYVYRADDSEGEGSYSNTYTISFLTLNAQDFLWCLKKGIDLFGLHAAGLCVYENEVKG